jgi:hypothetical protein
VLIHKVTKGLEKRGLVELTLIIIELRRKEPFSSTLEIIKMRITIELFNFAMINILILKRIYLY